MKRNRIKKALEDLDNAKENYDKVLGDDKAADDDVEKALKDYDSTWNDYTKTVNALVDGLVEEARIKRKADRATLTLFLLIGLFMIAINSSWMLENGYITDNKYEVWYPDTFVEVAFLVLFSMQFPAIHAGMKMRSQQNPQQRKIYFF